jgi:shikimate kinase
MSGESMDEPALHASRPPPRTIALIGLTGAGKSTLARKLANELHLPFVDSDHEIEAAARLSIAEIFETLGEAAFREGEQRVIARLLDGRPKVIATGGGAIVSPATRAALSDRAFTIWLRKDVEAIARRLSTSKARPVLSGPDPAETLRRLAREREPFYAAADLTFDIDAAPTPAQTLAAILRRRLDWLA